MCQGLLAPLKLPFIHEDVFETLQPRHASAVRDVLKVTSSTMRASSSVGRVSSRDGRVITSTSLIMGIVPDSATWGAWSGRFPRANPALGGSPGAFETARRMIGVLVVLSSWRRRRSATQVADADQAAARLVASAQAVSLVHLSTRAPVSNSRGLAASSGVQHVSWSVVVRLDNRGLTKTAAVSRAELV